MKPKLSRQEEIIQACQRLSEALVKQDDLSKKSDKIKIEEIAVRKEVFEAKQRLHDLERDNI